MQLQLELCPECGGPLSECRVKSTRRKRIVEDIPEGIKTETTQYEMPTYWCPNCQKPFRRKSPSSLPGNTIGNRLLTLTAWLHYSSGSTLSQVIDLFNYHLPIKLTPGGLVQFWARLIMDAITICRDKHETLAPEVYSRRCTLLESRLDALLSQEYKNPEAQRLSKRLRKHRLPIFTITLQNAASALQLSCAKTVTATVARRAPTRNPF